MVNSIAPGAPKPNQSICMETPEAEAQLLRLIPSGRVGDVEDVAKLSSGRSNDLIVNGTTLFVDGGRRHSSRFCYRWLNERAHRNILRKMAIG